MSSNMTAESLAEKRKWVEDTSKTCIKRIAAIELQLEEHARFEKQTRLVEQNRADAVALLKRERQSLTNSLATNQDFIDSIDALDPGDADCARKYEAIMGAFREKWMTEAQTIRDDDSRVAAAKDTAVPGFGAGLPKRRIIPLAANIVAEFLVESWQKVEDTNKRCREKLASIELRLEEHIRLEEPTLVYLD
ncbi:hypothetical protein EJ08DRAFT_716959 [Tothia fuscella]|uniref:Uncharacterized protein n=1 Tax=Tothia fuscella TaxID=1048955 RepID=A0A9P4NQI6_9PEZI|nr:hypothetical protein EJ08DRAFT_716959 [Tothia fuscella]